MHSLVLSQSSSMEDWLRHSFRRASSCTLKTVPAGRPGLLPTDEEFVRAAAAAASAMSALQAQSSPFPLMAALVSLPPSD
jgi:hypothetical protein